MRRILSSVNENNSERSEIILPKRRLPSNAYAFFKAAVLHRGSEKSFFSSL